MGWQFLARAAASSKQAWFGNLGAPTAVDWQGYPYANTAGSSTAPMQGLYGIGLVDSTEDLQLSDVQCASQNEYYRLALIAGASFSGTNHTLARHVRSWSTGKQQDWVAQVIGSGLAASVLGTNAVTSRYKPNSGQGIISAKEAQFLPIYLFDKTKTSAGTPAIAGV